MPTTMNRVNGLLISLVLLVGMCSTLWVLFLRTTGQSQVTFSSPSPTAEPVAQTFLLVGDTGTGLEGQYSVAEQMHQYCKSDGHCQAAFIAGDVIYDKGVSSIQDAQFKTKFADVYQNVPIPFYIAYGNHDYLGCKECYVQYASESKQWKFPSRYYTQEYPSVVFIVIDTEQFDETQKTWLQLQLTEYGGKKKVVIGHRPLETYEVTKFGENWYGKDELSKIVCTGADYYVSGHAHLFEYVGKPEGCSVELLVVGTGGASLRAAQSPYPGVFASSTYGFVSFQVLPGSVSWKFISAAGDVLLEK